MYRKPYGYDLTAALRHQEHRRRRRQWRRILRAMLPLL